MVEVALALGSNIGDKLQNLRNAVCALEDNEILNQIREASVFESDPMYVTDQPSFMNTVVVGVTKLSPLELLEALKNLENELGRQVSIRNGPRLIDLDIVLYGNLVISGSSLEIPHPRMTERPFVLQPLATVLPDWCHPTSKLSVKEMSDSLIAKSVGEDGLRLVSDRIR